MSSCWLVLLSSLQYLLGPCHFLLLLLGSIGSIAITGTMAARRMCSWLLPWYAEQQVKGSHLQHKRHPQTGNRWSGADKTCTRPWCNPSRIPLH